MRRATWIGFIREITRDYRNEKLKIKNENGVVELDQAHDPQESHKSYPIKDRTFQFALQVLRLCQVLDQKPGVGWTLGKQLLRSGTSIGANVEEAQAGQSKADFISKMNIALKEARETNYCLRLIQASNILPENLISPSVKESWEIGLILGSIIVSTKRKMGA